MFPLVRMTGKLQFGVLWGQAEERPTIITLVVGGATVEMAMHRSLIPNLHFQTRRSPSFLVQATTALGCHHALRALGLATQDQAGNGKKTPILAYDMDDGADDERTPLMSSIRSNRSARNRRPAASSMRQLEHQASRQHPSCLARSAGCLVLTLMILLVVFATASFVFATTQPLTDFKVIALKNVLASEQDLIFDLKVQGRNPNIVVVTIDTADLVVFAKSKYAGTDSEWWNRPKDFLRRAIRRRDDNPPDPPLDGSDPGTNPNLEIGHVYELDTSLTFDGSPFHHSSSTSTGQVRIGHPGNHTMPAGSDRWGNVFTT